jgi:hypothetical protein
MDLLNQPVVVFLLGGAAAGLVAWGSARTEIRFILREQREIKKRVTLLEQRRAVGR